MFFLYELEREITVHPSFLGQDLHGIVFRQLLHDVEGSTYDGYVIVAVLDSFEISEGRVIPGRGDSVFTVHYKAVVWRPFKGEVFDAIVSTVVVGGFFCEVGPMTVFVSRVNIPSEMRYDGNATPPQWVDKDGIVIEKGTQLRIKLMNIRIEVTEMFGIGSVKEDFLGPLVQG